MRRGSLCTPRFLGGTKGATVRHDALYHAVPYCGSDTAAVCGIKPRAQSVGWVESLSSDVTCPRCLNRRGWRRW